MKIIILSYSSVKYSIALYYKYKDIHENTSFIVFNNLNIVKFLRYIGIDDKDIAYYEYRVIRTFNPGKLIKQIVKARKFFYKKINMIENDIIYLFNKNECIDVIDLFFRIQNKNELRYIEFDPIIKYVKKFDFKSLLYKLYNSLFICVSYDVYRLGNDIITVVNDSFLKKVQYPMDKNLLEFKLELNVPKTKVILLETNLSKAGICSTCEYEKISQDVYNIINTFFCGEIGIKPHPIFNEISYNYYKDQNQLIDDFIPVEFIIDLEICNILIGVTSMALIDAINKGVSYVISTIKLYDYFDNDQKQAAINWLSDESNNKIIFPSSLNELLEVLSEINKSSIK